MMGYKALLLSTVLTCFAGSQALAQDAAGGTNAPAPDAPPKAAVEAAEPQRSGSGLEEILVTATRREERLQDIPVTVTAITAKSIESAGVLDTRSLTQVVPGFFGGRAAGGYQPIIRGVGSSSVSIGDEPNVATYVDGVYQGDAYTAWTDLVEIERVEVLRGPQGTVFGRNATGGLINVITPEPSFDARGRITGRAGTMRNSAQEYDVRTYLTTGLSDTVAIDFAGMYLDTDGYVDDLVRGGGIGERRLIDLRSKLLFQPSDRAKIILTAEFRDMNSSSNVYQPYENNTAGRRFPGVIVPTEPWQNSTDTRSQLNIQRYSLALRTQFEFDGFNLETTTGWMDNKTVQNTDSDSSNITLSAFLYSFPGAETNLWNQEVRLLSTGSGPLQWIVGGYAFHLSASAGFKLMNTAGPGLPVTFTHFTPEVQTDSYSGFAEGTYEITDSFFLTLGGRYTSEKRQFRQQLNGVLIFPQTAESTFDKFTYRAALRYNFAEDANIYASYGTGFKSGVFNMVGTSPFAVNPETIKAYEVGMKADPLHWLRTNLSFFFYDYSDLQVQARDPIGPGYVLQNAANAEIYGGEFEVTAAVTDNLHLRGALAYNHGEYTSFPAAQTFTPRPDGGNIVAPQDVSGNRITRTPRVTANLGFDWGQDLHGGRLKIGGNIFHSSRVFFDFANYASQDPYLLASGDISWTTADERWRFSLWATNITNADVYQEVRPGALTTDTIFEMPRRIGIGAEVKF